MRRWLAALDMVFDLLHEWIVERYELTVLPFTGNTVFLNKVQIVMRDGQAVKKEMRALEGKEAYHQLITENTADMISKHDPDGIFLFVSPASLRVIGYRPEELIGRNAYDYFHPDDVDAIRTSHCEIFKAPIVYTVPYRFRHKDGHYVWVEATSRVVQDSETQKVREIIAATRDMSARKAAEAALARRIEFDRAIAAISVEFLGLRSERMDQGIERALATIATLSKADRAYVFMYHDDGLRVDNTHEWCTSGVRARFGHVKGVPIDKQLPWFAACMRKQEIFALADGSELPPEARPERKYYEREGICALIVVPMTHGEQLLGFLGFEAMTANRNWSDADKGVLRLFAEIFASAIRRKRVEAALRRSDERWQFALEGAGDGVWDWDPVTDQVYYSRQWKAMLGYADHEIGNSLVAWKKLVHPDDLEAVAADLKRHFSGETAIYQNEHRVLCRDGSYKWILDRGKVIAWTPDGRPQRVIGTHSDISVRKSAETEKEKLIHQLQNALKEVKTLSGLLPICSNCKKIRDDRGYWRQIENYIQERSTVEFSHSLCQECARKLYPDFKF